MYGQGAYVSRICDIFHNRMTRYEAQAGSHENSNKKGGSMNRLSTDTKLLSTARSCASSSSR